MTQVELLGMLAISSGVIIGIVKFIEGRANDRNKETNDIRLKQIESTKENTLALKDMSNDIKIMNLVQEDHAKRIGELEEDVMAIQIYQKDRT